MNRLVLIISLVFLTAFFSSCEEKITYKYQDKPQLIDCEGLDKDLIHEALYSFQDDISNHYQSEGIEKGTNDYYINGYSSFIQSGLSGIAPFKTIVSSHTTKIMLRLKEESNLWVPEGKDTHLNYKHPFMQCLFASIANEDLRTKFESLLKVNYLTPKVLALPLRGEINAVVGDPHLAMYVALDGYYQNLYNINLTEFVKDE